MAFRSGNTYVEQAVARAQSASSGSGFQTPYINWKDGDSKVLRFFDTTEHLPIVVYMHSRVMCPDGKFHNFTCGQEFDRPCMLCEDSVPRREVGYSYALLRDEVVEGSKVVGFRDAMHDVEFTDKEGKKTTLRVPLIGVLNQSLGNFWSMIAATEDKRGPLPSYDLELTRKGKEKNTIYMTFPLPPVDIPNLKDTYKDFIPDVTGMLERLGADEYVKKVYKGIKPPEGGGAQSHSNASAVDESEEMSRIRRRSEELAAAQQQASA